MRGRQSKKRVERHAPSCKGNEPQEALDSLGNVVSKRVKTVCGGRQFLDALWRLFRNVQKRQGLPWGPGKESACQYRRHGLAP